MKRSSRVYLPEDDAYRISVELCGRSDPVIIDGGAHRGGSVAAFSRFAPQAIFHCFEPDPWLAKELAETFLGKPNVRVVMAALGETKGQGLVQYKCLAPNQLVTSSWGCTTVGFAIAMQACGESGS